MRSPVGGAWPGRAAALGVVLAAAGWLAAPAAVAQPTPVDFAADTTAAGVQIFSSQQPYTSIVVGQLVDDSVGYAESTLDTVGGSEAQAAAFYPGTLVAQGPQLLCSLFLPCPAQPPAYPLLADASYPSRPQASAPGQNLTIGGRSQPLAVTPVGATARAGPAANSADTAVAAARALSGGETVSVGTIHTSVSSTATSTALTVLVRTVVHDVTIGGVVHIRTVESVDQQVVRLGRRPVDHVLTTLVGVTADGQSASIDQNGVHVAGHRQALVDHQLAAQGLSVALLDAAKQDGRGSADSSTEGLLVELTRTVSNTPPKPAPPEVCSPVSPTLPPPLNQITNNLPLNSCVNLNAEYVSSITIAGAGAVSSAVPAPSFTFPASSSLPTAHLPGPAAPAAAGTPPPAPLPGAPAVAPAGGATPQVAGGRARLVGLPQTDIATLSLALAAGLAALFVGWRLLSQFTGSRRKT
jgi:hypothetical protein